MKRGRSVKSAAQILDLVTRKFEIAELDLHATARDIDELHGRMDRLNRTALESLAPASVQAAMSAIPNWRRKLVLQKSAHECELDRLKAQKENALAKLETALKQQQALSSYLDRRRKKPE